MLRRFALSLALILPAVLVLAAPLHAQEEDHVLTDAEVDQLRASAYYPSDRVIVFIKLLDERNKAIQDLFAHPRSPGREQDTHDLFEQFTAIADELDDNLQDYSVHHRDIRKALPKLVDAAERWSSNLKSPPDNEAYSVSRKIALEAIHDLREEATQLVEDQKAWFAAHPPAKEDKNKNAPIDIPR
jgi:hypothetical protein